MFKATAEIKKVFDKKGIKYRLVDKDEISYVEAGIRGENFSSVDVCFFSRDNDNDVSVRVMQICKVQKDKLGKMLVAINQCNNKFRYVKFVMDNDYDINLEYDMPLKNTDVGEIAMEMLVRIMKIMEEAYPILMKAMYA